MYMVHFRRLYLIIQFLDDVTKKTFLRSRRGLLIFTKMPDELVLVGIDTGKRNRAPIHFPTTLHYPQVWPDILSQKLSKALIAQEELYSSLSQLFRTRISRALLLLRVIDKPVSYLNVARIASTM